MFARANKKVIVSLALAAGLFANAAPATQAGAAELNLVTGEDYAPYTGAQLPRGGLMTEVVRVAYAAAGDTAVIAFQPWLRGLSGMAAGRFDAAFPYRRTPEREKHFLYSQPLRTVAVRPMVLRDAPWQAKTLDDLEGRRYCLPLGYALTNGIRRLTEAGRIHRSQPDAMRRCLQMLDAGRIDFVPMDPDRGLWFARDVLGDDKAVRFETLLLSQASLHVIFPLGNLKSLDRLNRFNEGLARIRADGRYDSIVSKHLSEASKRSGSDFRLASGERTPLTFFKPGEMR